MNFRKNIYTFSMRSALGLAVLAIAGCGMTPQDEGLGASSAKPVSAVVVDGYLAGATVYIDVNENNKLDAWEARALTDMQGYFSYNPTTPVNYCELAETNSLFVHCLKAPAGYDNVLIRMTQGYDLSTAEPFTGTISMRMNVASADVMTPVAATPITGLLAEVPADQVIVFLETEGISTELSGVDFLDFNGETLTEANRLKLLQLALQAHKVAVVIAEFLDPLYGAANAANSLPADFFGSNAGAPVDASPYVYKAIVSVALSNSSSIDTILTDAALMQLVIDEAIANLNKYVIEEYNARLPQDEVTGVPSNPSDMLQPIAATDVVGLDAKAVVVGAMIKDVFASSLVVNGGYDIESDATSRIRAIDAVVSMTLVGDAAATTAAVNLASDPTYMTNLRSSRVNMVSMKEKLIAGNTTAAVADFSSRLSFNEIVAGGSSPFEASDAGGTVNNQGFGGNTLALNKDPNDPGAGSVGIDFVGVPDVNGNVDPAATTGTMTIDANSLGGDFASADGSPLQLDGTWTKVDDYTMIMNIEVTAGVFEPVIVKPNDDGTGYYFDLGGEQVVWQ